MRSKCSHGLLNLGLFGNAFGRSTLIPAQQDCRQTTVLLHDTNHFQQSKRWSHPGDLALGDAYLIDVPPTQQPGRNGYRQRADREQQRKPTADRQCFFDHSVLSVDRCY
ncbi:hypothetical protein [Aquabacterium sp.]|uniref:hypothetical protein n=1 Tax=Aquabacterium sp. TaxID=1872578 RepID=UPI002489571B|nr:hypothetical protein [Aquabacterium sp.]MDI1258835.1 hypothetical protein [Aquabacterium sp.]